MDPERLQKLINLKLRGACSLQDFESRLSEALRDLSATDRLLALSELLEHGDEEMCEIAKKVRALDRSLELSKDINHVRLKSALQPGVRLVLFGGYDSCMTVGQPPWLAGHSHYTGTFVRFLSFGYTIPVACVNMDETIDVELYERRHFGRCALLFGRYSDVSPAWMKTQDTILIVVTDQFPTDPGELARIKPLQDALETHAEYRIVQRSES